MDPNGEFIARLIKTAVEAYASSIVDRQIEKQPKAADQYGGGAHDLQGDTEYRLLCLAESVAADRHELFAHEIIWAKVAMSARNVPVEFLAVNLACIREKLAMELPEGRSDRVVACVAHAEARLRDASPEIESLLEADHPHTDLTRRFMLATLETRRTDAITLLADAADSGIPIAELYDVMFRAQIEMGRMWQMNEVNVAEEHYGSRIAEDAMGALRGRVESRRNGRRRRVLCAAVGGNLHDIGLRAITDHLEWAGWDPIYLGASMPVPDLVIAAHDFAPDLIALSTALSLQVQETAHAIRSLRSVESSRRVPILVGGAPFCVVDDLWAVVGADAGATDGASAVEAAKRLMAEQDRLRP